MNDNIDPEKMLKQLGLSRTESATYLALLDMETVSIRKISSKSGINRGTTYEALKKLTTWGLVGMRQSGKREVYFAESPDKVFDIIKDKRKELWQLHQDAKEVVPSLLAQNAQPQGRPLVRYFEDDEGVVTILRDILQSCRVLENPEYYVYSTRSLRHYLYRKFPQFTELRINEGIRVMVIAIGEGGDPAGASERKWLPEPKSDEASSYSIIYANKVAHISISNDNTPYGVVIEDEGTAAMQKLLFMQIWSTL